MNWNVHSNLVGKHAFLSPSQNHWLNYDSDKLVTTFLNRQKVEEGVILHDLAARMITQRMKAANLKKAINMYVNDAIGFNMQPEQLVYYSDNCFGTADAISFKDDILRIHDLKTGITPCSFEQLNVYAALFCLEYAVDPKKISIENRIYQGNGYTIDIPDPKHIAKIMETIIKFDVILDEYR